VIGTSQFRAALLCGTALVLPMAAAAQAPGARPQGGQVVAGGATIAQDTARTQVTQSTDRAAIDWRSFDIGRDHSVQFQQPSASSVTLNRVTGPDPSQIAGRITANGQVAIVNQSGVVFHQGAQVDVAGLVVSSANITNQAFMRGGRMEFNQPGRPDARIENNGSITVREAGLAALVAPQVANHGTIAARMGRVALAGAETSTIDLHGDGLLSLEVTSPVRQRPANGEALVSNTGTITAQGGTVLLTASAVDGIVQDLVRAGGAVSADTDAAGRTGRVVVSGTGGAVRIEGRVSATGTAANTRGGSVEVVGDRSWVAPGAQVDASGSAGGGRINIGTNGRGAAATRLARRTGIAQGATVRADATTQGSGGTVIVNSADYTAHGGEISARGGPGGGDGGFVEVSGQKGLDITGRVNVSAGLGGLMGTFLIDPTNLTIVADADSRVNVSSATYSDGVLSAAEPPTGDAFLGAGSVGAFVGNLQLEASNNLTVEAGIDKQPGDLALVAGGTLTVTPSGSIRLRAGNLGLTASNFMLNGNVEVPITGGVITLTAAAGGASVTQAAGAAMIGGELTQSNPGFFSNVNFGSGNNQLVSINGLSGGLIGGGSLTLRNIVPLTVNGTTLADGALRIDVLGGDLTLNGNMLATGGPIVLRSSGNMTQAAGTTIQGPTLFLQAGTDFASDVVNPASSSGLTLAGILLSGPTTSYSSPTSPISLSAGLGGITQSGGRLEATTLDVNTPGSASLSSTANSVSTLANSSAGGDLTLVAQSGASFDLSLDGEIRSGGTLSLLQQNGNIIQLPGSVLVAPRLDVRADTGGITLGGDNRIGDIQRLQAESPLTFRNIGATTISGTVSAGNTAATLDIVGDLGVTGSILVHAGATLRATGNINLAAGSVLQNTFSFSQLSLLAGYDANLGGVNPASSAGITTAGHIGNEAARAPLVLAAGTGGIRQTGGQIIASTLAVTSAGDALLDGASPTTPNSVNTLGPSSAAGSFILDNGNSDLFIDSPDFSTALVGGHEITARIFGIRTAGDLTLDAGADILATERASFRVGRIVLSTGTSSLPLAPGSITAPLVEYAPYNLQSMSVNPTGADDFTVHPTLLAQTTADTLRLGATTFRDGTTTTATDIGFYHSYSFGHLDLRALGNITQDPDATLNATQLQGAAGGSVMLTSAGNTVSALSDFSAGGSFDLATGGDLVLRGSIQAPSVILSTTGNLTEEGAGRIGDGFLTLQTGGSAILGGANNITGLGPSTVGGDLRLNNTSALLEVPVGHLISAGGVLEILQSGDLTVDGTVTGATTHLSSPTGTIRVNGDSAIARHGDLAIESNVFSLVGLLQAAGEIRIHAGTLASLAGRAATPSLQIAAPTIRFSGLDASSASVQLDLGNTGQADGSLDAGGLLVVGGLRTGLSGTIAGIPGGPAAAAGQRATAGGLPLQEPLPSASQFLFNDCPIGAASCAPPAVPPLTTPPAAVPPVPSPEPTPVTLEIPVRATVADNPLAVVSALDPAASVVAVERLRPPVPNIAVSIGRDRSEEESLAPPSIRREDY
jgi:filamentous hemagglutinin family protein